MHGGARHNKIADSGKAHECLHLSAHLYTKTLDFMNAPGDQCCLSIIAVSESVRNTRAKCDDVLECSSDLHAEHVRTCIDTEYLIHENILHILCRLFVRGSSDDRCRDSLSNLLCMRGTAENRHIGLRNLVRNDL